MKKDQAAFENQSSYPFRLQKDHIGILVPRHVLFERLFPYHERYNDLESFRQQIEESKAGFHHRPYTSHKKSVGVYRSIFCAISLLFIFLGLSAFSLPSIIHTGLLFGTLTTAKGVIIGLCSLFSIASLTIGLMMQAEKEAVVSCVKGAKKQIARIYRRKGLKLSWERPLLFSRPKRLQAKLLRQSYREKLDKIDDKKDETLHLVHRITTAETLNLSEKESLLNQAIEELGEKLQSLIHSFKNLPIN